jgi:hypothetical protein
MTAGDTGQDRSTLEDWQGLQAGYPSRNLAADALPVSVVAAKVCVVGQSFDGREITPEAFCLEVVAPVIDRQRLNSPAGQLL